MTAGAIRFDGQVAIVTGAGRGLGREVALRLAARGCRVLVNDYGGGRSSIRPGSCEVAQSVVEEISDRGGSAIADGSDIGDRGAADAIVALARERFGRIDILVNNAGGTITGPIDALDDDTVDRIMAGNLLGPYRLLRRAWQELKAGGHGRVVNMLSSAMLGMEERAAYAAAKAGLMGLGAVAAVEGAPFGIRVNGVLPVVDSRLAAALPDGPLARWMKQFPAAPVAEAIVYLCSRACSVSGEIFSAGAGRVARTAIVGAPGFHDPMLTAESLADHIDIARSLDGATAVADSAAETALFHGVVPWPGEA